MDKRQITNPSDAITPKPEGFVQRRPEMPRIRAISLGEASLYGIGSSAVRNTPSDEDLEEFAEVLDIGSLDWQEGAVCREADPNLFFLSRGADPQPGKKICAACDIRDTCLEFAVANRLYGTWGGTSEEEREQIIEARALGRQASA